jgi:predicted O-methyltransferase YrrM
MSISINDLRFRIQSLLLYLIEGKSSMYIHSPKVFSFTENILGDKIDVELLRKRLKALDMAASCEKQSFQMKDFGKEGLPTRSNSISDHHRRTHLPHRYAEIIFKIAAYYRPATVLELGTSTGTAAISLATADVDHVITIDAEHTFKQFASNFALREKISCIEFLNQTFDQALPALAERGTEIQLAFIDGNHRYEPTINYCDEIMKMMTKGGIIILDDIHWSKEMNQAWKELRERSAVGLSIDLYRMGILFLEEGKRKSREHFRLYYF